MDEFRTTPPDDNSEISRKKRNQARIKQALSVLGEHFTGVLILAHEQLPNGVVQKYIDVAGDALALRYAARRWVEQEEVLENHRMIIHWLKSQRDSDNESGSPFQT